MTKSEKSKCHKIIHTAAAAASGVAGGMAQLPCADNAALVPIEVGMIIALGKVFGISMTESAARSTILTTGATIAGRTISQILLGWIPGIGNAVNAATAAGVVETLGWAVADDFDKERRG